MHFLRRFGGVLAFALFTVSAAGQDQSVALKSLKSMVDAERAFAAMSVKTNIRDSFLANFADDGIEFSPGPENVKETFSKRPASPNPPPVMLDWEPEFAEVSQAGDLGYTTGPFVLIDNAKKTQVAQGYFFSVWRKQADGKWKVVLDKGTEAPSVPTDLHAIGFKAGAPSEFQPKGKLDVNAARQALIETEKNFSAAAYAQDLGSDARMERSGSLPIIGKSIILTYLSGQRSPSKWEPMQAYVAKSGDLAYTYGNYQSVDSTNAPTEKGYYARVWKRDAKGNWKIVMDTAAAVQPEKK